MDIPYLEFMKFDIEWVLNCKSITVFSLAKDKANDKLSAMWIFITRN